MSEPPALPPKVNLIQPQWSIIELLRLARRNVLEIVPEQTLTHDVISGTKGTRWHMVTHPDTIRHIFLDNENAYPKSEVYKSIARPAIGESVFVADGAHWRWQRRAVSPIFARRNIESFGPLMAKATDRLCTRIEHHVGSRTDFLDEMVKTTFEVISDVTLSGDGQYDSAQVQAAFEAYISRTASASLLDIFAFPAWVPRPKRLFGARNIKYMTRLADNVINRRKERGAQDPPDLLDLLFDASDAKTGRKMSHVEIRNNLLTFIFAGHETTALNLAWAFYLVAFDQDVQERARAEAKAVLGSRTAGPEDVDNLVYCKQIIQEALRLYPPFALIARTAQKPDKLLHADVQKGDTVVIPIYSLHRNTSLWSEPDRFDPDRFAPGTEIHRFQYIPFGDGPRVCIGMSFALQEAVIILATVLSRYRFTRVPGKDPVPKLILTLRPEGGVRLNVERA